MTVLWWLLAPLAVAPAVYAWWTGRAIGKAIDDPALPELLLARQRRLVQVTLVAIIVSALVPAPTGIGIVVLLLAVAANYPTRRAVFGDRWSLWQYVRFTTFSAIAWLGPWLYPLVVAGVAVQLARAWIPTPSPRQTLLGAVLGLVAAIVYLIWQRYFTPVWLALHQATPIDSRSAHASLLPRFQAVLDRARVADRPTIHRFGAAGGEVVNAVALCSMHARGVAMSDALLDRLDADEATAVFAHEIAHHEHHDTALLRARWRWTFALALLVATVPPLQLASGSRYALAIDLIVLFAILLLYSRGQASHRAHETDCDLRAVELTGDPDSVVRALTKIHVLSRVPRRFSQEFERAATHPSLARRIQAIRAHGAVAEPSAEAPTIVASTTAGSYVALDDARGHWFDGVPAGTPLEIGALRDGAAGYRALAYGELGELRIDAETPRALCATDASGSSWRVSIRDDDVARLQATLDRVDTKLGAAKPEPAATSRSTARTVASVLLLATMLAGLWGMPLLVTAIGVFAPSVTAMAAMAAMALGHVAITIHVGESGDAYSAVALAAAAVSALWAAWIAWRWIRAPREMQPRRDARWTRWVFAALSLGLVFSAAALALGGVPGSAAELLGDVQVARASVALLGIGVALLTLGARASLAGTLATVAGVAGIAAGTLGDRWSSSAGAIAWSAGRLSLVATVPVGREVHEVQISPAATRFLTRRYAGMDEGEAEEEEHYSTQLVTGSIPLRGVPRRFTAIDAALPNESELFVLDRPSDDSLEIRLERHDSDSASRVVWRRALPALTGPRIQLDRGGTRWLVTGRSSEGRGRRFVTIGGTADGTDVRRIDVPADTMYGHAVHAYADGSMLVVSNAGPVFVPSTRRSVLRTYLAALRADGTSWTISRYERDGVRTLAKLRGYPTCTGTHDDDVAVCVERGRRATHVWSVARSGTVVDLGALSRRFDRATASPSGHVVASSYGGRSIAIVDVPRRRGVRASLPVGDYSYLREVQASDGRVAAVLGEEQGLRIAVYRLDPATARSVVTR
jgi:Zn-dependent protease with chaperone function